MKVFLIDDDRLSVFVTQHLLSLEENIGEINTFLSAKDTLDALFNGGESQFPDIIFLDLNMPIMDGWDFLDALEPIKSSLQDKCKIFILTSSLDTSDTEKIKDYPMVSYLIHKPIRREDIHFIISSFSFSQNSFINTLGACRT